MTTGSYGPYPPTGFLTLGTFQGKTWNGGDGKYESYAGGSRLQWHDYAMDAYSLMCTKNMFRVFATFYTQPPLVVDDWSQPPVVSFRPTFGDPGMAIGNDLITKAFNKLLERVKEEDFNLTVELGQLSQTVDLLSSNLGKLGRAALALRRGDFSTAARQLGTRPRGTRLKPSDVSGRWLELMYGWLPLLGSCFDAAKAFEAISNGPRYKVYVGSGTSKVTWNASQSANYQALCKGRKGRRIQYEMYEEMSVPRQMGLYDPFSLAWELTPWSFVIDWFYPIGQYFNLLGQVPFMKGRWLVTDFLKFERQKPDFKWLAMNFLGPNWIITVPDNPDATFVGGRRLRTFSSTPPAVPRPKFTYKGVNSTRRFWNAVSLAHQRFR